MGTFIQKYILLQYCALANIGNEKLAIILLVYIKKHKSETKLKQTKQRDLF